MGKETKKFMSNLFVWVFFLFLSFFCLGQTLIRQIHVIHSQKAGQCTAVKIMTMYPSVIFKHRTSSSLVPNFYSVIFEDFSLMICLCWKKPNI